MKKIIVFLMAICMMVSYADAQNSKALRKALKKEYKTKMKEYKKGGWQIMGSRSLDVALLKHYEKLETMGDEAYEVLGTTKSSSKNLAMSGAELNAAATYARRAGSNIKGREVMDAAGNPIEVDAEFERFYMAYENAVKKEIKGELNASYSIIRETGEKTAKGAPVYEIQVYYIINESAASKARIRAFENAKIESKIAQEYAEQISKFVNEGLKE